MTTIKFGEPVSVNAESTFTMKARSDTELITALRTSNGNLKLITWRVTPQTPFDDGKLIRMADSGDAAGFVSAIAMVVQENLVITAVRDGSNRLRLISWDVPKGLGSVTRLHPDTGDQAGTADHITMTAFRSLGGVPGSPILVTPVRTAGGDQFGNLKLITWRLGDDGQINRIKDSGNVLPVTSIATTLIGTPVFGGGILLTAVRTPPMNNLRLLTWRISGDGEKIELQDDSEDAAGFVYDDEIAVQRGLNTRDSQPSAVTAVRAGSGELKLITWTMNEDGSNIQRHGDSGDQGPAHKIVLAMADAIRPTYITASHAGEGGSSLELRTFETPNGQSVAQIELHGPTPPVHGVTGLGLAALGDGRVVLGLNSLQLRIISVFH